MARSSGSAGSSHICTRMRLYNSCPRNVLSPVVLDHDIAFPCSKYEPILNVEAFHSSKPFLETPYGRTVAGQSNAEYPPTTAFDYPVFATSPYGQFPASSSADLSTGDLMQGVNYQGNDENLPPRPPNSMTEGQTPIKKLSPYIAKTLNFAYEIHQPYASVSGVSSPPKKAAPTPLSSRVAGQRRRRQREHTERMQAEYCSPEAIFTNPYWTPYNAQHPDGPHIAGPFDRRSLSQRRRREREREERRLRILNKSSSSNSKTPSREDSGTLRSSSLSSQELSTRQRIRIENLID
ncbi:hypothetical protein CVT26_015945 [Gymnopilus dilepis]|uniref:Uncharacterized protein n=1 Tax=Gymnopilus dilepis TaxID=231916 RepID=A0A409XYG0_9AGAR|nr:hypothetical protein CVT26_015945 [Gymnopilus dilepis]